jgi:dihydrofolate synthase/folylpolyglutamate synthase
VVTPLVSVITNIGLDHMQHLGGTISEIAAEKGGIIKPGVPVVTAARQPEAIAVIESICQERGSALTIVEQPVSDLVGLAGEHQRWNAATALAALAAAGLAITPAQRQQGLANVVWPGRLQVVAGSPPVVLDGAHNVAAVETLLAGMKARFGDRPVRLILGILRDKEYARLCELLAPVANAIWCVAVNNARTCDPRDLAEHSRRVNPRAAVQVSPSLPVALRAARGTATAAEVVLITGSLFLVGEALSHLELPFEERSFCAKEMALQ